MTSGVWAFVALAGIGGLATGLLVRLWRAKALAREVRELFPSDTVEIVECPPKSKLKRCNLVRVGTKSKIVDIAAMRAADKALHESEPQA